MPQLIIALILIALAIYLIILLIGAALWVLVIAVITFPAGAAAFGMMYATENLYCRRKVKDLHDRGKLNDMLHVFFKDAQLHWRFDSSALSAFTGSVPLISLLFVVGLASVWLILFCLSAFGVLQVEVGVEMFGSNPALALQINEIIAYAVGAIAIGSALVYLPRSFHRVMVSQAENHIRRNRANLELANSTFQDAIALYEEAGEVVLVTGSATLLRALEEEHKALHDPILTDFLKREDWEQFDVHVQGLIEDLEKIKELAENFVSEEASENQPESTWSDTLSEEVALQRLGFKPGASPSGDKIKRAFRQLSRIYHPDKTGDLSEPEREHLTELFKLIKDAYEFLQKCGRT